MIQNYFKTAWRNIMRSKGYSLINIGGLAIGMTITIMIGLWIFDELNFNKSFSNYERVGQAYMHQTFNGHIGSQTAMPVPVGKALKDNYPEFEEVAMASWNKPRIIAYKENKFSKNGMFVEPSFTKIFSLKMKYGTQDGLRDVNSIMLSETLAKSLFGSDNPIGKIIKIDNKKSLSVTGVFKDFPANSNLADVTNLGTWAYYENDEEWVKQSNTNWGNNSFQCFTLLKRNTDINIANTKIRNLILDNIDNKTPKPKLFVMPMSRWHLYSEYKEGVNTGGRIQFVWLFGIIGLFVLLLACINFMNLSTARSEKRAKEVGIRKAVGSARKALIFQFLTESVLVVAISFLLAIGLSVLLLPFFNDVAGKSIKIPWNYAPFWIFSIVFIVLTGVIAGSYPALYLSSFNPVKVLKGTFRAGRFQAIPRKILVVVQFTVSVALIIGTIIIYQQIQYAKNRPVGYDKNNLIYLEMTTPDLDGKYDVLRSDLKATGMVEEMSKSSSPVTAIRSNTTGFNWEGKTPGSNPLFGTIGITHEFGKTVGFQIIKGRDFSREFLTDSAAFIINESAAAIIGGDVVGKFISGDDHKFKIIGVIKDMVMQSPYDPMMPTVFWLNYEFVNVITIKIKQGVSMSGAIEKIGKVFKKYNPGSPFEYQFVDQDFGKKFEAEERIGKLAGVFGVLAILISCLGLFGLASFVAEQRIKEIGIRKVLGASVGQLWAMLSKDFLWLVIIACVIAAPLAYYFLHKWLQGYDYRTNISGWVFVFAGIVAVVITILTVSFQAIKAAAANPIKSLRTE